MSLKVNLLLPWYSWKIAELALNNNQSLNISFWSKENKWYKPITLSVVVLSSLPPAEITWHLYSPLSLLNTPSIFSVPSCSIVILSEAVSSTLSWYHFHVMLTLTSCDTPHWREATEPLTASVGVSGGWVIWVLSEEKKYMSQWKNSINSEIKCRTGNAISNI